MTTISKPPAAQEDLLDNLYRTSRDNPIQADRYLYLLQRN